MVKIRKSCDLQFASYQFCTCSSHHGTLFAAQRSSQAMAVFFVSLILVFASCQAKYLHEPLTREAIDYINKFTSWKADPDFAGYDVEHFKKLCGVELDGKIPPRPKKLGLLTGLFLSSLSWVRVGEVVCRIRKL